MAEGEARDGPIPEGLNDPRAPWEELVEDPGAPRRLLAVMFTDIVSSTELASSLGDKRWRELVDQHHAAVRAEIARFGGTEVDTAGDAFFATFDLPLRAVDCALEAVRAARRLGLRIRAGVHMGECVVSAGSVRGVTVHIGARVGAKASGGQVLVSSTVREVLAGAGLTFQERGEHTLKGVDGRWRLYEVRPRVEDKEGDLPPLLEADLKHAPIPAWKRPRARIALATALVVLIAGATFTLLRTPSGLTTVPADSVALIDARSMTVKSFTRVGARPVGLATTRDGVWVANSFDRSASHVSLDGRDVTTIGGLGASPASTAIGANLVWIANVDGGSISRLSPQTKEEVGNRIQSGNGLSDVSFGAGALWATNSVDGTVWRIDPSTGTRTHSIDVGPAARGLAVEGREVWVASEVAQTVTKIDARSVSIVSVVPVGHGPRAVALSPNAVWVANAFDGTVSRVNRDSGAVVATIPVGAQPRSIAVAAGRVFVANEGDATISVIDPGSNRTIRTIPLHNAPMALAAQGDHVWLSVRGGASSYRGGTLRIGTAINDAPSEGEAPVSFDPAYGFVEFNYAVAPMQYDGLLAFKKTGGVEGAEIVPDLAEDLRPPTDGGKTYSFTLRSGLRYSNGSPVRAADVRASIERIFRKEVDYPAVLYSMIAGAEKCSPKACDLSASIVTDDAARTVVFHLRRAFSDFPTLLSLPFAGVVPANTPSRDMGVTPIPGTGPYRLVAAKGDVRRGGSATLGRNPNFHARGLASPGGFADRVVVSWGGSPALHVLAVKEGSEDFTIYTQKPDIPVEQLAVQVPAQLHIFDLQSVVYATLDLKDPPFNDVRARRALNLAIDRNALATAAGGALFGSSTCQVLPRNMIGYRPYCPYTTHPNDLGTWNAPDLATARRLVAQSKTYGMHVTIWLSPGERLQRVANAKVIRDALNSIGYKADVREFKGDIYQELFSGNKKKLQAAISGWAIDYPSASSFFVPLLMCPDDAEKLTGEPQAFNVNAFCSRELDRKVEQALEVQRADAKTAGDLWAAIDRAVVDDAPWVPLTTLRIPIFVSARVGNVLWSPAIGPLVSQMWVNARPT